MTPTPSHWFALTDRGFDLPVAVFDLDGVISDAAHRQWFLREDPPDWDGFFGAAVADPVIDEGLAAVTSYRANHHVTIVTARPEGLAERTIGWLRERRVGADLLILRPRDDHRASPEVKRAEVHRLRAQGADLRLAVDDDPRNVEMYRQEGVAVHYVHSGYYEDGTY